VFAGCTVVFGIVMATVLGEADLVTYGPIFSLGVVALSFVPLAGYAGQISLCQLSMAGIGAVVWGHLGAHGNPAALIGAVLVAGLVGALVAVPALRLSGVYLALGTAAFAVVLDRWIFTLPSFDLWGIRVALFDQGAVTMTGPWLFGWHLDSGAELMVLAAVCLALASVGVAALRRGRAGRRLIALRDSEAAYATLGGNLLLARVAVFGLSAGIAGLGGALYGMQQRAITAEQFTFVAGLPLFLVAVIGGLGAVGTGLFTGTAYIWPLNALTVVAPWAQNLVALLPSLAGIGLGRDPDGIVTRFRRQWTPLGRDPLALTALAGGLAVLWLLRLTDVIGGWLLFFGTVVLALVARAWATERARPKPAEVPVEWWGVRRPWRAGDEEVLNRVIAGG
jgi:branched-chain amino acid transport system permease protein